MNSNLLAKIGLFDTAKTAEVDIAAFTRDQLQEASNNGLIGPPVAEILIFMYGASNNKNVLMFFL